MNKVLVAYASKHGATKEIAGKIGEALTRRGLEADVIPAQEVKDLVPYGGVVLGSAAYIGLWRRQAVTFLKKNRERLSALPVWLFLSGPTGFGDPKELLKGWRYPKSLAPVIETISPRDIACFGGRINRKALNPFERWVVRNVNAPEGDFRDWDAITAWAEAVSISGEEKARP